jgi:hypothetical protein
MKQPSAKSFEINQFLLGNFDIFAGKQSAKIKLVIEKMFHDCSTGGVARRIAPTFFKRIFIFRSDSVPLWRAFQMNL